MIALALLSSDHFGNAGLTGSAEYQVRAVEKKLVLFADRYAHSVSFTFDRGHIQDEQKALLLGRAFAEEGINTSVRVIGVDPLKA